MTKKVLILGSGALQIGQAGEFDYSGSQAIKALKEEGIKTILINPNIATIQTSQGFADKVYFLPVTPHFVEEVIKAEKPNYIALSFGGQTALNCGLELSRLKILNKYNVKVLGTPIAAIETTEDRKLFSEMLKGIHLKTPKSEAVTSLQGVKKAAAKIGFPVMVRGGFSLGGQDSGVAYNLKELELIAKKALSKIPQILIEEYLSGWKEIEYEVVRDKFNNCITVCNMENIDPMGIHTGESIVVAPSQTLNNFEYHTLREISLKVIRHLGIIGECNIQFALNPSPFSGEPANNSHLEPSTNSSVKAKGKNRRATLNDTLDYRIIEVNARLSRSSALASKATGYPLAYVAAKLALGQSLTQIKNSVTKTTIACFEPALDYLVIKFPRWDLNKFIKSQNTIGSSMQSVGEVMAIGRKFEEAIQKASRMLDIGLSGILDEKIPNVNYVDPTPWRLFAIAQSIKRGESVEKIAQKTKIDKFFLHKIKNVCDFENKIQKSKNTKDETWLKEAKQLGFSDKRLAAISNSTPGQIRSKRQKLGIVPSIKQIDTLAAEYPAKTNYLYLTYNGDGDDVDFDKSKKVIILGSGPYRIGSSVEFDWSCVTSAQTARENGFETIILNCNPETVSTDYDMASRLYFDELTAETVMEIYEKENPKGVIVSMGGQTPNNLVMELSRNKVNILGTSAHSIDQAEDRNKFSKLCDSLSINQPAWSKFTSPREALSFAQKIGFPVLIRPSYVLSGAAMNVAFNKQDLNQFLEAATNISDKYPVVITKFVEGAKEIEIDAIADNGKTVCSAISEHVENAGVHSGDATLVLPPQKIYHETERKINEISNKIAANLKITGPFNIQFLAKDNEVMVIECNLRASRSLPFVSKVTGVNFASVATRAMLKINPGHYQTNNINYVGVKTPQFSFSRIKGADPVLRVEMSSTGEVAAFGRDIHEAFLKSILSTGIKLPQNSVFISLGGDENKIKFLQSAQLLKQFGLKIYATSGTSKFLKSHGIENQKLYKIYENKKPSVIDFIMAKKIDLVINVFIPFQENDLGDGYLIRRATIDFGIPLLTNLQTAELFAKSLSLKSLKDLKPLPWENYVRFKN